MKSIVKAVILTLGLSLPLASVNAQEQRPERPERPQRPERPERPEFPAPPLMAALDQNKNGELDATEISQASESLAKLDKNGDGKLTREELRPQRGPGPRPGGPGQRPGRPDGARGEGRGERGPRGERGQK